MKNIMLFQALREFTTGLLNQLLVNLAGQEGQIWLDEFKKFLRQEPCWVKEAKAYFRRLFTFKLRATDGKDTNATACEAFRAYFDSDFENWGITFSSATPEVEIVIDELVQDGKFSDFLGTTAEVLEKRRLLGSQFFAICRDCQKKLRSKDCANFFVLTKGDERVAKDLSNVFVAEVVVSDDGELHAILLRFQRDRVWFGVSRHRFFSPQQ